VGGIRFGTSYMVRVTPLPRRPFFQTDRFRAMLAGRRLAFPDPGVIRLRWQWSGDRRCALLPSNEPRPACGVRLRARGDVVRGDVEPSPATAKGTWLSATLELSASWRIAPLG
jgi:hypothetical protein